MEICVVPHLSKHYLNRGTTKEIYVLTIQHENKDNQIRFSFQIA